MIFAEATNESAGNFWFLLIGGSAIVLALIAIASYFATSREVDKVGTALDKLGDVIGDLNKTNEQRAHEIHLRLNPLESTVGELKGSSDAFEKSFEKFTRIIEATSRANNETISAFTRSLDTFANVVERSTRERARNER